MNADASAAFDRRLYEALWNRGDLALVDEFIAPDVAFDGQPLGRAGYRAWVTGFRSALPDLTVRIEGQVADAERVVSRLTWRGTHTGEFAPHLLPGWSGQAIAPTGRAVTWRSMTMHRIVDGHLVEGWLNADMVRLLGQLGVLTAPAHG